MPKLAETRSTIYIGIDPGASGGIAGILPKASECRGMPQTETDIWGLFRYYQNWHVHNRYQIVAVIEKVGGFIQGGEDRQPGSAMFKFGMSYGGLRMALIAAGIPFEEVAPRTWQKALGIAPKRSHTGTKEVIISKGKRKGQTKTVKCGGESSGEFKNRLKAKAQQLFPQLTVTLATADSLLIAVYCQRKHEGTLGR